jgi:hypothetical protein
MQADGNVNFIEGTLERGVRSSVSGKAEVIIHLFKLER